MKLKKIITLILLLNPGLGFCFDLNSINEAQKIVAREDGRYDVYCENSTQEIVSEFDIALDNICPQKIPNQNLNILSLKKNNEGLFDVICTDHSQHVASKDEIISGKVCLPLPQKFAIMEGTYLRDSKDYYFCKRYQVKNVANNEKNETLSFNLKCSFYQPWHFICNKGTCVSETDKTIVLKSNIFNEFQYESESHNSNFILKTGP